MTDKDLTASELALVKRQVQRVKALGDGRVTIEFEAHHLKKVGIYAEMAYILDTNQPSLDHPQRECELRD